MYALDDQYSAIDLIPEATLFELTLTVAKVRSAMRRVLDGVLTYMYYEEKSSPSANVHIWILPVYSQGATSSEIPSLPRLHLKEYLSQFNFARERDAILATNSAMRRALSGGNE